MAQETNQANTVDYTEQTLQASKLAMSQWELDNVLADIKMDDKRRSIYFYLMGGRFGESYTTPSYASQWIDRIAQGRAWNLADSHTQKVLTAAGDRYGHIKGVTRP